MSNDEKKTEEDSSLTEEQAHQNPVLAMTVEKDSELKTYLVDYVGDKFNQEEVSVNMVAEVLAHEFPEFVYALAEENFLRGYQMGVHDAANGFSGPEGILGPPTGEDNESVHPAETAKTN